MVLDVLHSTFYVMHCKQNNLDKPNMSVQVMREMDINRYFWRYPLDELIDSVFFTDHIKYENVSWQILSSLDELSLPNLVYNSRRLYSLDF